MSTTEQKSEPPAPLQVLQPYTPVLSIQQAKEFFAAVQEAKKNILTNEDFTKFTDKNGKQRNIFERSGVEKMALYFGISVRLRPPVLQENQDGSFVYSIEAVAFRDGREVSSTGACHSGEKEYMDKLKTKARKHHDVLTHAETRAWDRAVMKFLGLGEVTASEVGSNGKTQPKSDQEKKPTPPKEALCVCPQPRPRYEKSKETGYYHCVTCNKIVTDDVVEQLKKAN